MKAALPRCDAAERQEVFIMAMGLLKKLAKGLRGEGSEERPPKDEYYAFENKWRWDRQKRTLTGRFRSFYCAPKGRLERHPDGSFTLYIIKPPDALVHPNFRSSTCFPAEPGQGKDVYRVHFHPPTTGLTIDGGIMEVERNLIWAWEQDQKGGNK
jgi:hypothetical protein